VELSGDADFAINQRGENFHPSLTTVPVDQHTFLHATRKVCFNVGKLEFGIGTHLTDTLPVLAYVTGTANLLAYLGIQNWILSNGRPNCHMMVSTFAMGEAAVSFACLIHARTLAALPKKVTHTHTHTHTHSSYHWKNPGQMPCSFCYEGPPAVWRTPLSKTPRNGTRLQASRCHLAMSSAQWRRMDG
jgi:hypothetical protein